MKASEIVKALQHSISNFGDHEVKVGANIDKKRVEQNVSDVLSGNEMILLVSKGFMDNDPLFNLPHLSLVTGEELSEPKQ